MKDVKKLYLENFGPIKEADIEFGDLTVVVGPQATGKSILMQTLRLILDKDYIHDVFAANSVDFKGDSKAFMNGYYGNGMASLLNNKPSIWVNDKEINFTKYTKLSAGRKNYSESLFFIPAQRVVSLPSGQTQPFSYYRFGDPYSLRSFSDTVHRLLQSDFGGKKDLFPQPNRLRKVLRDNISDTIYGGAKLVVDEREYTKHLALNITDGPEGLPFLAWSAGQREFTPLLLGMYWLCPPSKVSRKDDFEWVVIEEPEMGLHPQAINTTLLMVIELMSRGYKVIIATHSPQALDMVWALRIIQKYSGNEKDVRQLFGLKAANGKQLAESALEKKYRVYYFQRDGIAKDISDLDPGSNDSDEAYWGGLTEFAGRTGDVVSQVVNRADAMSDD